MVNSSSAYGCSNRYVKDSNIHFHKFPLNNPTLNKSWIVALKRDKFIPSKYSAICSQHFTPSDYVTDINDLKPRLKPDAIPSIFNFPDHLKNSKNQNKRKPPTKRKNSNDNQPSTSSQIDISTESTQDSQSLESPPPKNKENFFVHSKML